MVPIEIEVIEDTPPSNEPRKDGVLEIEEVMELIKI